MRQVWKCQVKLGNFSKKARSRIFLNARHCFKGSFHVVISSFKNCSSRGTWLAQSGESATPLNLKDVKFKPHTGWRNYLKIKSLKKKKTSNNLLEWRNQFTPSLSVRQEPNISAAPKCPKLDGSSHLALLKLPASADSYRWHHLYLPEPYVTMAILQAVTGSQGL